MTVKTVRMKPDNRAKDAKASGVRMRLIRSLMTSPLPR